MVCAMVRPRYSVSAGGGSAVEVAGGFAGDCAASCARELGSTDRIATQNAAILHRFVRLIVMRIIQPQNARRASLLTGNCARQRSILRHERPAPRRRQEIVDEILRAGVSLAHSVVA